MERKKMRSLRVRSLNVMKFNKKVNEISKNKNSKNLECGQRENRERVGDQEGATNGKSSNSTLKKISVSIISSILVPVVVSVLGMYLYNKYQSGNDAIRNEQQMKDYHKAQDVKNVPAEIGALRWWRHDARYFENGETKQEIAKRALDRHVDAGNRDGHYLGTPQLYCNGLNVAGGQRCVDIAAQSSLTFTLKGVTNDPISVTRISAKIDSVKDFSPEALYYVGTQGVSANAQIGFDLGADDLEAREVKDGLITNTDFMLQKNINVKAGDDVPITASILAPPGKEILFHIEIFFEDRDEPLIVRDGNEPLRVVSYPTASDPADKTYVPVHVENSDRQFELTQCSWPIQCQDLFYKTVGSDEVSAD